MNSSGNCYEVAALYIIDHCIGMGVKESNHDLRLIHGEVFGQGPLEGLTYGHAWIEDGDTVIDRSNSRDIQMPKLLYYAIGGIGDLNNIHIYTPEQARAKLLKHKIYGPWDLQGRHPNFRSGPQWAEEIEEFDDELGT